MRLRAEDDLEVAVRVHRQLVAVDKTGLHHAPVGFVTALLRTEAQVRHRAAPAADAVCGIAVQARVAVQVVRIVRADLGGFM
ncbi:hypothetical protein D3C71_1838520 [compost metagenome]